MKYLSDTQGHHVHQELEKGTLLFGYVVTF